MKKSVLILITLVGFLSSCSKFDDLSAALEEQVGIASVAVFNGLPGSGTMELYVDGSKLNVSKTEQFHNWHSGRRELKIVSRFGDRQDVYQGIVDLQEGRFYSLFVHRDTEIRVTKQEDDPLRPKSGSAKVRIAHLSSQVPEFQVQSMKTDKGASAIKYKEITSFTTIPLELYHILGTVNSGANNQARDFEYKFIPKDQSIYTLIIRDNINVSDPSDTYKIDLIVQ